MSMTLLETTRGRIYLVLLAIAGLCLIIAPSVAWLSYSLQLSQGGAQSEVSIFVTGLGSILVSPEVSGVSFSFPILQGWSYGTIALTIGIVVLIASLIVFYRPELGGLIGFVLSFINMSPSLFFLGRSPEVNYIVGQFVLALQNAGFTILASSSSYGFGFIINIIGTALLPISSILILSNATKLRMAKTKKERRKIEEEKELPGQ